MPVVPMQKVAIVGHHLVHDEVIAYLQKLGLLEITPSPPPDVLPAKKEAAPEEEPAKKKRAAKAKAVKKPVKEVKEKVSLASLPGVGEKTIACLKAAGIKSVDGLAKSSAEALTKVKGLGQKKAQKLIAEAKKLKE